MAGKYLKHAALVDVIRDRERINALQKREGLTAHPVSFTSCGCPDPGCGGWHRILLERSLPTADECTEIISASNKARKRAKRQPDATLGDEKTALRK